MKTAAIYILLFFSVQLGFGQDLDTFFTKSDTFFKTYVANGRVDYSAIKDNPAQLKELVDLMAKIKVDKSDLAKFQAFYINAYNIATINGIVKAYPVASPMKIGGFFDSKKHDIGGKSITLNHLENKILRANFPNEPRFHFALVCAGLGCPPIINEAYLPNTLDKQLTRQSKAAINDPNFTKYQEDKKVVELSQIFEWYNVDFTRGQTLVDFVNKYRKESIPKDTKVKYYKYNWDLNDKK